ncbi:MAG: selenium metabolism-associated LysR family transcriptional regulator [Thermodesulfovibrio sp.]|nr:selenium metabolism-associated LysR family transcriptional regulator [Thermodesulfovibrio sp.]MDW7998348.1 selenium metabolism-associated LysR family transcriptional regulator [Thermodesulfovibrio sp.]
MIFSMDIHHLRIFISVFKHKSFSKAAKELFLTQPTISEHIKTLEEELNCKLFDRFGKIIIPTKEAEILYENAQEVVDKVEGLKDILQKIKSTPSGNLHIAASSIPGTYILPRLISSFKNNYPEILIQIEISDSKSVIENLISGDILLGVVGTKLGKSKIFYHPFMNDELVIVSPNFIEESYIEPEEILKYPFITREEGSGTRKEMEKWLKEMGIDIEKLNIVCTLSSTDAVKEAIKNGMGISILSIHSIKDELEYKKLKIVRIKNYKMNRIFYIATHTMRSLPYIYKLFYEFLKEKAFSL